MHFRNNFFLVFFILFTNCTAGNIINNKPNVNFINGFNNKGFALIYNDDLFDDGLISRKIDERSLIIFQKNLKINTHVKITNILNNKSIIAKVGNKSDYPSFNNSVLSIRIAKDLDLDTNEPYVEIIEIHKDSIFIAKKAKTYDEEKNVAIKAPIDGISINDLNEVRINSTKKYKRIFSYKIKIADFYFNDTAKIMVNRIMKETLIKNVNIKKISKEKYRVYLGPFSDINSLQKSYNDIRVLEFENIEIIGND